MSEITQDQLKQLFERADEYCKAKHDFSPSYIKIYYDGELVAVDTYCNCEDWEEKIYTIPIKELNTDLDTIRQERLKKEAEEAENRRIAAEKEKLKKEESIKKTEYSTYLSLKRKFEAQGTEVK